MLSRKVFNTIIKIPARSLSSGGKVFHLTIDDEGIAVMNWRRKPVNSFNLEAFQEIITGLDELGKNEKYKGLIITSDIPKIFSAGIDLTELNKPDPERLKKFWGTMQDTFLKLHGSEVPTTVAINGYTAAGACMISLMCDYRVMVSDKSRIGFNDSAVGIVPSWWVREIVLKAMGYRQAELAIISSKMYTPEEALKVQMIDELATDKNDAIEKCKKFIRPYFSIPRNTYRTAKRQLRASAIDYVQENREKDIHNFVEAILSPYTQEQIGKFVEQLQHKK